MDHHAVFLDTWCSNGENMGLSVLAVSEMGVCYFWHGKTIDELRYSKPTKIYVQFDDGVIKKSRGTIPNVFAAKLQSVSTTAGGHIFLAHGFIIKPSFEKVVVQSGTDVKLNVSQDGAFLPVRKLHKSETESGMPSQGKSRLFTFRILVILYSSTVGALLPVPKMFGLKDGKVGATAVGSNDEGDLDEATLCMEDRLRSFGILGNIDDALGSTMDSKWFKGIDLDSSTPHKKLKATVLSMESGDALTQLKSLGLKYQTNQPVLERDEQKDESEDEEADEVVYGIDEDSQTGSDSDLAEKKLTLLLALCHWTTQAPAKANTRTPVPQFCSQLTLWIFRCIQSWNGLICFMPPASLTPRIRWFSFFLLGLTSRRHHFLALQATTRKFTEPTQMKNVHWQRYPLTVLRGILRPLGHERVRRIPCRRRRRAEKYLRRGGLDWPDGGSSRESMRAVWKLPRPQNLIMQHVDHSVGDLIDLAGAFEPSPRASLFLVLTLEQIFVGLDLGILKEVDFNKKGRSKLPEASCPDKRSCFGLPIETSLNAGRSRQLPPVAVRMPPAVVALRLSPPLATNRTIGAHEDDVATTVERLSHRRAAAGVVLVDELGHPGC
ncbi:transducin family protein / WD-40 repeat family protein [Striga hermonthica]|uniref:Transducin family protein / WD-40 repeat family protein n=1 Tax=Striga hermonthica TaxID=68872 RepID=A0A9N7R8J8_STRHE|nr:transducin family protein / WD-40 repeat family protein [Striga hermonthica]